MSETIPIINLDRVPLCDVVPLDMPYAVYAFPATLCNFKCIYCAHALGQKKMREQYGLEPQIMDIDTFKLVIEQMKSFHHPVKLLSLTGQGEPLINKNLPDMVYMAKQAGIAKRIEIITNAALLTNEIADSLIDAGLDGLRVSLQGMSENKYKEICGINIDFDNFLLQLSYFYKNKRTCDLFVKIMDVSLDEGDEEKFYETFNHISDRMYVEQCRPVYEGVAFTENIEGENKDRYGNEHIHRKVCPLCFFQLGVFPDGDVVPDDAIYKPVVLGNVHHGTLKDMWNGEKLRSFWHMQLRGERLMNPKCAVCCAPDDVSHPLDVLDDAAGEIIKRIENG
jgi:GTP 3',8-cyclase